ncbi:MAG: TIGR00303 family protein [Thermosphaera sp.]
MSLSSSGYVVVKSNESIGKLKDGKTLAVYVIGSTMTSTIPGISIAGTMPIATLFTPALDVEYLYYGKPVTLDAIPTTPEGIPTPAIITRISLQLSRIPFVVVDAGSYVSPKIPTIALSSRCVGGRIDKENALPFGTSEKLFKESKYVGSTLGTMADIVLVGESIPAGTTTAMAILRALGYPGENLVSSSTSKNPLELKKTVVYKALQRVKGGEDPFTLNDIVGDPLHISIAGLALGVIDAGSIIILAGGTQMLAVLGLMKKISPDFDQSKIIHATTKWIIIDKGKEILDFIRSAVPGIGFVYSVLDFSNAPFQGLRAYEEGFVKEGVGAGGTAFLAMTKGINVNDLIKGIYQEYRRIAAS